MTSIVRRTMIATLLAATAASVSGCSYNTFVSQEEEVKRSWSDVKSQLQRRNDLIPNLVATVKGISQQEKDVFGQIAESRSKLASASTPQQTIEAANQQSAALGRLIAISENYPQLRSSESYKELMDNLQSTENRINVARLRYNENVQKYNVQRRRFPSNITASVFGFKDNYPLFDTTPGAEKVPTVDFKPGS
jgi:LemA protein